MFYVYILFSASIDQFYVGHTHDLQDRLFRHNNSGSLATKKTKDWILVHKEEFTSKEDAYNREMQIKRKKSRKYIQWLIAQN